MARDFTLDKYRELCEKLLSSGYRPCTVYGYLTGGEDQDRPSVVLRHDVDRKIKNSLRMAELEAVLGIAATYYFRYPSTFDVDIIARIQALGHEVGYHYEVLSKAHGDYENAIDLFAWELAEFKAISDVRTICMHGRPLSQFDNRDLWTRYNHREFGIEGEAYLSMDGIGLRYFTDTGRSWSGQHSVRDAMAGVSQNAGVNTTDDLIKIINSGEVINLYLTTHPERWAANYSEWYFGLVKDRLVNSGKCVLVAMR